MVKEVRAFLVVVGMAGHLLAVVVGMAGMMRRSSAGEVEMMGHWCAAVEMA